MHERNIFKDSPPNFKELASEFNELSPYISVGLSGKPFINFKDPASLRALSTVILKKFFKLSIDIPLNRLIPTIPLRLNYIHWIEDLIHYETLSDGVGIDIGCGASCVYSLLCWKLHKWKMITTEIDDISLQCALLNVKKNDAQDYITVVKSLEDKPIFASALEKTMNKTVDFSICNPPFFSSEEENCEKNRTSYRTPSPSVCTASQNESHTTGGEVHFIKRMIDESLTLKTKIRWFTSMLGKKSSVAVLKKYLKKVGVETVVTTEFKQGRTMRWGLGWSFVESQPLSNGQHKKTSKSKPFHLILDDEFFLKHQLTKPDTSSSTQVSKTLLDVINLLSVECEKLMIECDQPTSVSLSKNSYELTGNAYTNTWTNQRAKRRKLKYCEKTSSDTCKPFNNMQTDAFSSKSISCLGQASTCAETSIPGEDEEFKQESCIKRRKLNDSSASVIQFIDTKDTKDRKEKLFTFTFTCELHEHLENVVLVSFQCLDGNRELFHQLFLYFKNFLQATQVKI